MSQNKRFRASIIVWGMPKSLSTLEIRAKLADIGLASFARGSVAWEGDHVRLLLLPKDSKGLSKDVGIKCRERTQRVATSGSRTSVRASTPPRSEEVGQDHVNRPEFQLARNGCRSRSVFSLYQLSLSPRFVASN